MADFVNSVQNRDVKFVDRYKTVDTAYTSTGTKTITVSTGSDPGLRAGYFRIRTKSVNASSTNIFEVQATDGTTTVEVLPATTITAAGLASDIVEDFHLDISATTFTLTITLAGNGNETVDFEVAGCK